MSEAGFTPFQEANARRRLYCCIVVLLYCGIVGLWYCWIVVLGEFFRLPQLVSLELVSLVDTRWKFFDRPSYSLPRVVAALLGMYQIIKLEVSSKGKKISVRVLITGSSSIEFHACPKSLSR
jgi:hypothetical protein